MNNDNNDQKKILIPTQADQTISILYFFGKIPAALNEFKRRIFAGIGSLVIFLISKIVGSIFSCSFINLKFFS